MYRSGRLFTCDRNAAGLGIVVSVVSCRPGCGLPGCGPPGYGPYGIDGSLLLVGAASRANLVNHPMTC
jgi:hypothetical protein